MIHENLRAIIAKAPAGSGLRQGDRFMPYAALLERIARTAALTSAPRLPHRLHRAGSPISGTG